MDYDYNKLFADTYGFTHEKNLNAFDRSYDPDDFSDYEEYDTDIDEDFSDNEIEVSHPEIVSATIKNDEIQPSELEIKFNKLNQVVFDNEFQHLEDPLFLTSSEKKQVLPLLSKIEGTQDSVEVYQALVPESRGHLAYNQQVTEFVSDVIKTHYPPAVAQNFSLHLKEFFEIERYEDDHNHFLNERFKLMDSVKDPEVLEILRFDEDQVPYHQNFNVYIPTKDARQDFVFRHNSEFRIIEEFELTLEHRESYEKIMSLARSLGNFQFELESIWFRYQFSKLESNVLAKSILLVSHPMMIPQHFRQQFNELIILPEDFYFHEKSESFRFFELMFVRKKHKIFLPSRRIQLYILKFFKVYFSSDKLRFVKKLPPIIRRLNIMDIYHPTSNVIENLTRADFGIPHVLLAKEQIVTGIIHSTTMPPINSRRYKIVSNPFRLKEIGNKWNPRSFYRFKFH